MIVYHRCYIHPQMILVCIYISFKSGSGPRWLVFHRWYICNRSQNKLFDFMDVYKSLSYTTTEPSQLTFSCNIGPEHWKRGQLQNSCEETVQVRPHLSKIILRLHRFPGCKRIIPTIWHFDISDFRCEILTIFNSIGPIKVRKSRLRGLKTLNFRA